MRTVGQSQLNVSHKRDNKARTTTGFFHRSHYEVVVMWRSILIMKNGQIIRMKLAYNSLLWLTVGQPSGAQYLAD